MDIGDEEIFESEVEFRELDCEPEAKELPEFERNSLDHTGGESEVAPEQSAELHPIAEIEGCNEPEAVDCNEEQEEEARKLHGNDEEIDESSAGDLAAEPPPPAAKPQVQLDVSDEYLDLASQEPAPISRKGGGGKWSRRKRRNPFISFFLSMYSRRPRQRAAEVARQAGRQWARMSDSQRKLYTREAQLGPS